MMPKFSHKLRTLAICAMVVATSPGHADNLPCEQWSCCEEPCAALWADFIYWNVCQDNMDVAITDSVEDPEALTNAETRFLESHYKPGFRLGASYRLPCNDWSLEAVWARYHTKQRKTIDASIGGQLIATQLPNDFTLDVNPVESHSEWKTKYDTVDILLAKTFCCGNGFKFKPYGGARLLWFKQKLVTNYFESADGSIPSEALWRVYLPAGGATVGFEGGYAICDGISLIGHFGGSFLGGRVKHHQEWTHVEPEPPQPQQTVKQHHCQFIGGWDASIGLGYESICCSCPWFLSIGYEIIDWWNMPQRPRYVNGPTPGSLGQITTDAKTRLTLHGLFVRLGTTF